MTELFNDPLFYLGLALIVVLPSTILALGEMKSRMARSGSRLLDTVAFARSWVIPVLAVWAVLVMIANVGRELAPVRLLETLLLVVAVAAGLKLVRAIFVANNADGEAPSWRQRVPGLLLAAPRLVLVGLAVYAMASLWGLDVTQAFAALGVGSLIIALALQDTLSGLVSGFLLMADRPFQPGDWIRAGDVEGRVMDVRWRTVRVITRQNTLIVVPNAVLAGEVIRNHSAPDRIHRIDVDFDIAFSNSPTAARNMLLSAARQTRAILEHPPPTVAVTRVDDPLMGYQVQAWIESYDDEPAARSELRDRVWYQSQRDKVSLPSPAYDLYHWDGPTMADADRPDPEYVRRGLRAARVVRALDETAFEQLVAATEQITFAAGELISDPTAGIEDLFILGAGQAGAFIDADGKEHVFDDLGPGDIFGLVPLTDLGLSTGVRAVADCDVFRASRTAMFSVLARNGVLADELKRIGGVRSRRAARVATTAGLRKPETADPQVPRAATPPTSSNGLHGDPAPESAAARDRSLGSEPTPAAPTSPESERPGGAGAGAVIDLRNPPEEPGRQPDPDPGSGSGSGSDPNPDREPT